MRRLILLLGAIGCSRTDFVDLGSFADTSDGACGGEPIAAWETGEDSFPVALSASEVGLLVGVVHLAERITFEVVALDVSSSQVLSENERTVFHDPKEQPLWMGSDWHMATSGDALYIVVPDTPGSQAGWFVALDLSKGAPKVAEPLSIPGSGSVHPFGTTAFVALTAAMAVIDAGDSANPSMGIDPLVEEVSSLTVVGDQLLAAVGDPYVTDTASLVTFNLADPTEPVEQERQEISILWRGMAATSGGFVGVGVDDRDASEIQAALFAPGDGGWDSIAQWAAPTTNDGNGTLYPTPVVDEDRVFFMGEQDEVVVLDTAGDTLEEVARWSDGESFIKSMVVRNEVVWAVVSRTDIDFDGIVGLDFSGCR